MKLHVPFVQLPVQFDAARLLAEIEALGPDRWIDHPQKFPGNFALPLIAVNGDPTSDAIAGPMRPTPALAECPYLMQVLHRLGAVWGRTRLMKLSGHAEVTPHTDLSYYWRERVRVHVPIRTKPNVRFYCGDTDVNMGRASAGSSTPGSTTVSSTAMTTRGFTWSPTAWAANRSGSWSGTAGRPGMATSRGGRRNSWRRRRMPRRI